MNVTVSAAEQYFIELINRARLDPGKEAQDLGIGLNSDLAPGTISTAAKMPLAINDYILQAADDYSQWMLDNNIFSHTGPGNNWKDRMEDAGYSFNGGAAGENLSLQFIGQSPNMTNLMDAHHRALFDSEGHRENFLSTSYRELGVGEEQDLFNYQNQGNYNASMLTNKFAKSGNSFFVTGVAYDDNDNDEFYSIGEARANVTFSSGGNSDQTMSAGGYSIAVNGSSSTTVNVSGSGVSAQFIVDTNGTNAKVDLVDRSIFYTSSSLTLVSGIDDAKLLGFGSNLSLTGNANDNELIANRAGSNLSGMGGHDTLTGHDGNDTIAGGGGGDSIFGDDGADSILGGSGADIIDGADDGDYINVGLGNDRGFGGAGNDTMMGGAGADSLHGGTGNDSMVAGDSVDTMYGEAGNDYMDGQSASDSMMGGQGSDTMIGARGVDTMDGGSEADFIDGGLGNDSIIGGSGDDTIQGGDGGDSISGGAGADLINAGLGADTVSGGSENDEINGGGGRDLLRGDDGNDILRGGTGADTLSGGAGNDTMSGGSENDVFWFTGGDDVVLDFNTAEDRIVFEDFLWSGTKNATQVVNDHATASGGDVTFTFGSDTFVLENISDTSGLADLISIA